MLGDKTIDFSYYGVTYRDQYVVKDGVAESSPAAKLVEKDTWDGYYVNPHTFPYTPYPDMQGTTLNESIQLWKVNKNASFNHCTFCVLNSSTLTYTAEAAENESDAPLAIQFTNVDTDYPGFSTNPQNRLAYDQTSRKGYERSALVADIEYPNYCFSVGVSCFDETAMSISSQSLSSIVSYINADPDKRCLAYLRPTMNYSTEIPRILGDTANSQYINEIDGTISRKGVPYADVLSNYKIPDIATNIKTRIKDGYTTWEDKEIYAPFGFNPANDWYGTESVNSDHIHRIGTNNRYTVTNIINGAGSPAIERGRFFRCNFIEKCFDDVCYQWKMCCIHEASGRYLENGFDLTTLPGSSYLRFFTKLVITDRKGNTEGQAVYNAILHEIAYIGFYFCKTGSIATNRNFLADSLTDVFCPVFENGVTTGLYKTGDDIKTLPNWNSSSVADEVFKNIPGASDSDSGDLTTHTHSGYVAGGAHWYGMTTTELGQLSTWLNTTYQPTDETEFIQDFKGVNPADYIVSIKYYPFAVPTTNLTVSFVIGGLTVPSLSPEVLLRDYGKGSSSWYDLGSITLQQPLVYGDFRDKYIKMLLYVPWCGMATIDPAVFCPSPDGTIHTLSVALSIDFATGSCTGYIYRDYTLIDSIQGSCGIDIPMSAVNNGSYQNQIKQTEIALKQAENTRTAALVGAVGASIATGAAIVTGNPLAVAAAAGGVLSAGTKYENAALQVEGLQYQLEHTAPAVGNVSAASPFNNMIDEQAARIFIFKPVMLQNADVAAYGHTVGYACCKAGKLSSFSGFTVCSDADLSGIKAPSGHKTAIMQLLQGGVYL